MMFAPDATRPHVQLAFGSAYGARATRDALRPLARVVRSSRSAFPCLLRSLTRVQLDTLPSWLAIVARAQLRHTGAAGRRRAPIVQQLDKGRVEAAAALLEGLLEDPALAPAVALMKQRQTNGLEGVLLGNVGSLLAAQVAEGRGNRSQQASAGLQALLTLTTNATLPAKKGRLSRLNDARRHFDCVKITQIHYHYSFPID